MPILTRPFEDVLARILSYYQATSPMPFISIEHPMQNVDSDALAARALQIADAVESMLGATGADD